MAKKVVKIDLDAHTLLKYVSFKKGKSMSLILDDLIKNTFKKELEELKNLKDDNK